MQPSDRRRRARAGRGPLRSVPGWAPETKETPSDPRVRQVYERLCAHAHHMWCILCGVAGDPYAMGIFLPNGDGDPAGYVTCSLCWAKVQADPKGTAKQVEAALKLAALTGFGILT